jgi:microcystin-dependent protein
LGETGGAESITLLTSEIPGHAHAVGMALAADGNSTSPANAVWAQSAAGRGAAALYQNGAPTGPVQLQSLAVTGGGLPHNNMQPYLTLNFCIALQGVFPPRS